MTLQDCAEYVIAPKSGCKATFSNEGEASAFDSAAVYERIQEEMAELSGGTAATTLGPSTFLNPSSPAEPTPELGEGEAFGLGAAEEGEEEAGEEAEAVAPRRGTSRRGPTAPQRALLDYLLGP